MGHIQTGVNHSNRSTGTVQAQSLSIGEIGEVVCITLKTKGFFTAFNFIAGNFRVGIRCHRCTQVKDFTQIFIVLHEAENLVN